MNQRSETNLRNFLAIARALGSIHQGRPICMLKLRLHKFQKRPNICAARDLASVCKLKLWNMCRHFLAFLNRFCESECTPAADRVVVPQFSRYLNRPCEKLSSRPRLVPQSRVWHFRALYRVLLLLQYTLYRVQGYKAAAGLLNFIQDRTRAPPPLWHTSLFAEKEINREIQRNPGTQTLKSAPTRR